MSHEPNKPIVTVIWGDTNNNPGVFHFVEVAEDCEDVIRAARLFVYENPKIYAEGDLVDDDGEELTPEQMLEESFTLVGVFKGRIEEDTRFF